MAEALRATAGVWPEALPLNMLIDHSEPDPRFAETDTTSIVDLRERARPRKRSWAWTLVAVAVALVLLAGGAFKLHEQLTKKSFVPIPRLEGVTAARARRSLESAGLHAVIGGTMPDYSIPKGSVVAQVPASGRLLEGSRVRLIVSSGLPRFDVPTVMGGRLDGARSLLRTVGLTIGNVGHRYSGKPAGTVIAQHPSSGTLAWGSSSTWFSVAGPSQPRSRALPD